jgi:hypothetical protein
MNAKMGKRVTAEKAEDGADGVAAEVVRVYQRLEAEVRK